MSESSKKILSTLMVMGASSPEKAMASQDLAEKLGIDHSALGAELKALVKSGYAQEVAGSEGPRIYLTGNGVITASSTYS